MSKRLRGSIVACAVASVMLFPAPADAANVIINSGFSNGLSPWKVPAELGLLNPVQDVSGTPMVNIEPPDDWQYMGPVVYQTETVQGVKYILEYKAALTNENWTPLLQITGDGGVHTMADTAPLDPSRFYRFRMIQPPQ